VTVSPDHGPLPDRQPPSCDEPLVSHDEPHDERSTVISLALAALVTSLMSWARVVRFLVIVTVLVAVTTGAVLLVAWLVPGDVTIGPVRIIHRGD
jgi:hypothetical protein